MNAKPVYQIETTDERTSGGYLIRHVRFRECEPEHLGILVRLCEHNRAGYGGGLPTAERMAERYTALLDAGHYYLAANPFTDSRIEVGYQRYEEGRDGKPDHWCRPSFDVGEQRETICFGADLLRRFRKEDRDISSPEKLIAALADMFPVYAVRRVAACNSTWDHDHVIVGDTSVRPVHVRALKAAKDAAWSKQTDRLNRKLDRERELEEKAATEAIEREQVAEDKAEEATPAPATEATVH